MNRNKKTSKKVVVLGCGVMGSIFIKTLRKLNYNVIGIDKGDSLKPVTTCDILILATKPQDFKNISLELNENTLVISIMAGISINTIKKHLGVNKIVRSMPNMNAQIGQSFTAWASTSEVGKNDKKFVSEIFSQMGESMEVATDDMINKVTAVSGSGPAYIFYMIASFIKSAQSLGFSESDARAMVMQTIKGSLAMITPYTDIETLIKNVTSKGGTTEAGLAEFEKAKISKTWVKTLDSAYKRAKKLSR